MRNSHGGLPPPTVDRCKGEVSRLTFGHRLFVLRMVNCGNVRCKKCSSCGASHGPYWYEIARAKKRNYWKYRGKVGAFDPHEFVKKAKVNRDEQCESEFNFE